MQLPRTLLQAQAAHGTSDRTRHSSSRYHKIQEQKRKESVIEPVPFALSANIIPVDLNSLAIMVCFEIDLIHLHRFIFSFL